MDKEREKELEHLKFDYWNKSKLFKSMWRYYRAKKLDPSTPFPDQFKQDKIKNNNKAPKYFTSTYKYWLFWLYHDPETASFDDYCKFREKARREFLAGEPAEKTIYVEDYRERISEDFGIAIDQFKMENSRTPEINEVMKYLTWFLESSGSIYLKINQIEHTYTEADKISEEVKVILKKRAYRVKPETKTLRQYLRAWELRHESKPPKSYLEIYNLVIKKNDYDVKDKKGKAKRYVSNAKRIIENLEAGKPLWCKIERRKRKAYLKQNPKFTPSGY